MNSFLFRGIYRLVIGLFLITVLPAFMVPVPKDDRTFITLPLPPGIHLDDHLLFAARKARSFLFLDPDGPPVLHYLTIDHPMDSPYFLHEEWNDLPLPAPETLSRIRSMALGKHFAYLSGTSPAGEPILRMLALSPRKKRILGYTDFMPESGGAPIRELILDRPNGTLWMTFDNGQISTGHSLLLTPGTILSTSPEEALTQTLQRDVPDGPDLMPVIRKSQVDKSACLSCRLFLVERERPTGKSIRNVSVRTPTPIDISMGMIPIGLSGVLFAGDPSVVCHIPSRTIASPIGPCHRVNTKTLPADGILWGSREVFLLHLKGHSFWRLAIVNRELLEDPASHNRPLNPDFPMNILLKKAVFHRFGQNARPIPGFWSTGSRKLALFGHKHLYLLLLGGNTGKHPTDTSRQ